jgi:PqqD family protein of HPr-rel-A system
MTDYAWRGKLTLHMDPHPGTHPADQPPGAHDAQADGSAPMTVPPTYQPAKSADVLELDMGDGLILYNHDSSLVHHLNPSAALVWQLCDGEATVGQLATEIAEEYSLRSDEVVGQISAVIAEFDALDLVQDSGNGAR